MEFSVTQEMGRVPVTVLQVEGAIDQDKPLVTKVKELYDTGMRNLLLDLSQVSFMNSLGLRAINQIFNLLRVPDEAESEATVMEGVRSGKYKSGHFKLLKPSKFVQDSLHLVGFDMFIEVFTDYQKAVDSF